MKKLIIAMVLFFPIYAFADSAGHVGDAIMLIGLGLLAYILSVIAGGLLLLAKSKKWVYGLVGLIEIMIFAITYYFLIDDSYSGRKFVLYHFGNTQFLVFFPVLAIQLYKSFVEFLTLKKTDRLKLTSIPLIALISLQTQNIRSFFSPSESSIEPARGAPGKLFVEVRAPVGMDIKSFQLDYSSKSNIGTMHSDDKPLRDDKYITFTGFSHSISETEERRFVVVSSSGQSAQVFKLNIKDVRVVTDWSDWLRPDFLENTDAPYFSAAFEFADGRSTDIPEMTYEIRYKMGLHSRKDNE